MNEEIPFVDRFIHPSNAEGSILSMAPYLFRRCHLSIDDLHISELTQGTTNALFMVSAHKNDIGQDTTFPKVLVKIYGAGTDITIDRDEEIKMHKILSDNNLASALICRFKNGHAYEFLDGAVCLVHDITNRQIWRGVAQELAKWHAILPIAVPDATDNDVILKPSIWSKAERWLSALPSLTEQQRLRKQLLQNEYHYLTTELWGNDTGDITVFGHCDLLCGNIIVQKRASNIILDEVASVKFIDYEHSALCPRAFELANHFAEWAGFECDYRLLPATSTRHDFIREYLQSYHDTMRERHSTGDSSPPIKVTQAEVDDLAAKVDTFRGFPGFYWGLCALIQDQASTGSIDFDYAGYAEKRFSEYWAWRGKPTSHESFGRVREQRWTAP